MVRDLLAFVVTLMECVVWIEVCNGLARKGLVNLTDSRKLIHIGEPGGCKPAGRL